MPVKVFLILLIHPREARCGVEEMPRDAVRRWRTRRDAMGGSSGALVSPVSRRRRGAVGSSVGFTAARPRKVGEGKRYGMGR